MTDLTSTDSSKSLRLKSKLVVIPFITTLLYKGYSGSDGTMVGEKYSWLAPLARLSPLCPYSGPAVLLKLERSSILWRRIRRISPHAIAQGPSCSKAEVLAVPWLPVQPPISSSGLTYLSINQKQKQKSTELL